MKHKIISTISILAISSTLLSASSTKEIKLEAKTAIMKMGKTLKMNMKKSMKKGGVVEAAKFCASRAAQLESDINKTYKDGVSVKRVTIKPRNQNNMASSDERIVLNTFEKLQKEGKALPKMIVKEISKNHYKVYKPMVMGGVCLKCHGNPKSMNKEVVSLIKEYYPNDKAMGYKKGDFRGAFVAEIIKK